MLQEVKETYGDRLQVNWKNFSLEQINSTRGPDWKVWEQPDDFPSRGLPSARAAEAARRQGPGKFEAYHVRLLSARHEERKDISKMEILEEIAQAAGLDLDQFRKDFADPEIKAIVGRDHTEAVEKYGVFGTPTFFPGNEHGFYLKIMPAPKGEEALEAFQSFYQTISRHPNILEIKQPSKPRNRTAPENR